MRCSAGSPVVAGALIALTALLFSPCMDAQPSEHGGVQVTVLSGVPLHIRVTRTVALRKGTPVEGILTEPVYVYDRLVFPKDAVVRGSVSGVVPAERRVRVQALLNGDVTPLHDPVVNFTSIRVGDTDVALSSEGLMRNTKMISFVPGAANPTLMQQAKKAVKDQILSAWNMFFAPGKKDRALKMLYGQMPYHPQRVWAGTQFIADLNAPAEVTLRVAPSPLIVPASASTLDSIVVTARLANDLSSDVAKKGDAVIAVVTKPVFNPQQRLVLAEGARLEGTVLHAKASGSFARNGELRFVFRSVQPMNQQKEEVHGTLTAAEGNGGENISVDHEGGVASHPDKNRFVAPLLLGALAVVGHDRDSDGDNNGLARNTVASNGFGLVARILALTVNDRNVATGFAAYATAKSVYFRFIARGHAVTFPRDTLVQVQLAARR
jgi:hypothetical protein